MQPPMSYTKAQTTTETILSIAILFGLGAIAAAVLVTQGRFDVQQASYPTGELSVEKTGDALIEAGDRSGFSWPDDSSGVKFQVFDVETLADLINGKAETYFQAGFERLYYKRVSVADDSKQIGGSVYIFQMLSGEAAFSVYSTQRRAGSPPIDLGDSAYHAQNLLAFIHGQFYVEFVCDEISDTWLTFMRALGQQFVDSQAISPASLAELALFPAEGLVPDSFALAMRDVFSFDRFDRVYTARYTISGHQATAFLSVRASPAQAKELAGAYATFLTGLTGETPKPVDGLDGAVFIDVFGEYEVIFSEGNILAGVHAADDPKTAEDLARKLGEGLTKGLSK